MKLKIFCLLTLCLFISYSFQAQNKLVGKVMNFDKEPIVNAQVFLGDKKTDVLINSRGYFEIDVPNEVEEINIYSPAYGLLSTVYSAENYMSFIFLNPTKADYESKKVDIGYDKVNREDLSYDVQKFDPVKDNQGFSYNNIYDLIRGRLPGVSVTANNKIVIRGSNSIYSATDPLFIVDGSIVYNIYYIRPTEVKDISVLKDAAASIYGSQGANGVIQITLKN